MQDFSGPHHEKHCINLLKQSYPVSNIAFRETFPQLIKNQLRVTHFINLTGLRIDRGSISFSNFSRKPFFSLLEVRYFKIICDQIQVSISYCQVFFVTYPQPPSQLPSLRSFTCKFQWRHFSALLHILASILNLSLQHPLFSSKCSHLNEGQHGYAAISITKQNEVNSN